jgi:hypothetical protein
VRQIRMLVLCIVVMAAFSAAATASAFAAESNPQWTTGKAAGELGEPLIEPNTIPITAEANGTQKLITEGVVTVECTGVGVEAGATLNGGNGTTVAGKDKETLKYTGCTVEGKKETECAVSGGGEPNGTIKTKPLTSRLAWASKKAAEEENDDLTDTVFKPESGKEFVELDFTGEKCSLLVPGKHKVEGEVAVENEPPATTEHTHGINAPKEPITEVWSNVGGVATKEKVETFTVEGVLKAKYEGKSKVTSANTFWGIG